MRRRGSAVRRIVQEATPKMKKRKPEPLRHRRPKHAGGLWIYGLHPARAALANPRRRLLQAVLTERAAEALGPKLLGRVNYRLADPDGVARLLPPGAVHQGAALEAEPLPPLGLADAIGGAPSGRPVVLVLDQIADPHNVGAILRSAAAFGAAAVIVQDRHAPAESGALAKAASGALDLVPYVVTINLARALEELGTLGFWRIALAGDGEAAIAEAAPPSGGLALVIGSEGAGLRRLVRERCDVTAFIRIDASIDSLNVSNAAAIALYELRRG